ncbi:hypothetical protein PoB_001149100 [Plakobranchus ocellatus]|uniref:Uncharacterized protein n=1 Tax=Plakobranchus ocellatus TaxID=259542 RepID=A0AAV3YRH5_9GAST|nr:hypothetical protein PoB_001149100 [Plakobranchus ocellatus]
MLSCNSEAHVSPVGPSATRLVCHYCVSSMRGTRRNGFARFVRLSGTGQCPPFGMGCYVPERYPLAARQGCHDHGSKHDGEVYPASHAVGGRPGSVVYLTQRAASTSPERKSFHTAWLLFKEFGN